MGEELHAIKPLASNRTAQTKLPANKPVSVPLVHVTQTPARRLTPFSQSGSRRSSMRSSHWFRTGVRRQNCLQTRLCWFLWCMYANTCKETYTVQSELVA